MRQRSILIDGQRRLAWTEWGRPGNPELLLCVHGLTRSGRDFDRAARSLSDRFRVACVDIAGRGQSSPMTGAEYELPNYVADIAQLLAHLRPGALYWLGTSMGGLVGLCYAAAAPQDAPPIRRLVLNDIGPEIPRDAILRIADYVGRDWRFADLDSAEKHIRKAYEPFALRSDADWRWFTEISVRRTPDGNYVPAYDPVIGERFAASAAEDRTEDMWPVWESLAMPVLVLRGELSDVLPEHLAREMSRRSRAADIHPVPGAGHAPPLLYEDEIAPLRTWLTSG